MEVALAAVLGNPLLILVLVLVLAVIVVNGATDAANAIATVISTRCMRPWAAIIMAAICNFLGLLVMTGFSTAVADTISGMVNFQGDSHASLVALAAAMVAVVAWGVVTWIFGIPTSQSHSLIAALTGAAIALQGGLAGVNGAEWVKVIYGLFLSTIMGFVLGWLIARAFSLAFRGVERHHAETFFGGAQIVSAALLAFVHGAQDGQKFMSIAMLALTTSMGLSGQDVSYPLWVMLSCSLTMGLGTAIGGKRIIKSVAMEMTKLEKYQGFAASLAASVSILASTLFGLPVSTTHTKTTAIMGVGAEKSLRSVKWGLAGRMVFTWVLTFPGCGLLAFAFTHLFLAFF